MLSTPNRTVGDGSLTRRRHEREQNNAYPRISTGGGLVETINSLNRRESTYEGDGSPKT